MPVRVVARGLCIDLSYNRYLEEKDFHLPSFKAVRQEILGVM
jgi:hypothetical protein